MYLLQLSELVAGALCQVPIGLQEVVVHLVNQDTRHRPSARTLVQISYFGSVLCCADTVNIIDNIIRYMVYAGILPCRRYSS